MSKYRSSLPQLTNDMFITDGGIETYLIFHEGIDLPHFAAFDLFRTDSGRQVLMDYYRRHARIARDHGVGFIFETATWRASPDWARQLNYSQAELAQANQASVEMLLGLRDEFETPQTKCVISGCVGPRGDGYDPERPVSTRVAQTYHGEQISTLANAGADLITAITMTNVDESIGIARACQNEELPVVISFTVETDGKLPTGDTLQSAIEAVDNATDAAPSYYMINCAHPTHFDHVLDGDAWLDRINGVWANASKCSHEELDEAEALDEGNPHELGQDFVLLQQKMPKLNVLGGCCGTDHRHIEAICMACKAA
ncbi:MAG: homocysteine S-methyltransferase family protein [Stappiaceae bacterium]